MLLLYSRKNDLLFPAQIHWFLGLLIPQGTVLENFGEGLSRAGSRVSVDAFIWGFSTHGY
jgi:hypothetical protein